MTCWSTRNQEKLLNKSNKPRKLKISPKINYKRRKTTSVYPGSKPTPPYSPKGQSRLHGIRKFDKHWGINFKVLKIQNSSKNTLQMPKILISHAKPGPAPSNSPIVHKQLAGSERTQKEAQNTKTAPKTQNLHTVCLLQNFSSARR